MRTIFTKLSGCFLSAVLTIGIAAANTPCALEYYQPQVPKELKK